VFHGDTKHKGSLPGKPLCWLKVRKDSSFSEEKEAKRLLIIG
jgi:hypothetical protein